jgi:hypothetical protein
VFHVALLERLGWMATNDIERRNVRNYGTSCLDDRTFTDRNSAENSDIYANPDISPYGHITDDDVVVVRLARSMIIMNLSKHLEPPT